MIRRSTIVATAALLLSLLTHVFGLSFSMQVPSESPPEGGTTDVVVMGNAFEDIAEAVTESVAPEPAPVPEPEPPVEPLPEPERAETPTTMALVASDNPKPTASPDTGSAPPVQADTVSPIVPEQSATAEPETVEPSLAPPVETAQPPDAAQHLAALPVVAAPTLPVTPTPEPAVIPVIPSEQDLVDPKPPEVTVEPIPEGAETAAADDGLGGSDLAVVSSPRPQLPSHRPSTPPTEQVGNRLAPSPLIESPLTTYKRDGNLDGWLGNQGSRGPGNSDVTNYAGRVLVHLNHSPTVRVRSGGTARVVFEINRDGTLAWVDVINSTGTHEFDSAAREQVRNAVPFPRPPQGANRRLSFVFRSN